MDGKIFKTNPFNIPPSEKALKVFYLELQEGCPYNQCNYCKTFKGIPFMNKPVDQVMQDFTAIRDVLSNQFSLSTSTMSRINRVYLGGADILAYSQKDLRQIIYSVKRGLEEAGSEKIRKVAGYSTTRSLKNISQQGLSELVDAGLNVLYWGLESGSDEALSLANKHFTKEDALVVADKIKGLELMASVNIMPGLGGIRLYDQHVSESIEVLSAINPRWVTYLSIDVKDTEYDQIINNDSDNRHLNREELKQQMLEITFGLEERLRGVKSNCKVASYGSDVTSISHNPITFTHQIGEYPHKLIKEAKKAVLDPEQFLAKYKFIHDWEIQAIKKKKKENRDAAFFGLGFSAVVLYMIYTFASHVSSK